MTQLTRVFHNSLTVVVSLITIVIVTPWFGIAVIPIFYIYVKVLNYFREVSRETKRLDSISRSPVYAHFSETLGGLGTIRAYGQGDRFIDEFEQKVDTNTRAYYNNKSADRWLSVRLEMLGAFIAGLAAVFASNVAISNAQSGLSSPKNFASVAGLSLTYAISVTGLLNWVVRSFAQMEAAMNAAERVLFYTESIPQEAPASKDELNLFTQQDSVTKDNDKYSYAAKRAVVAMGGVENPSPEWPSRGDITLNNLKMRYRPDNPLVIKGLNVEIKGGQRVGVVGRTGSGKSSLLLTLLRIVEPFVDPDEKYESPIVIDGVDVLRIGLTDLRSKIGIIPQNPVLFSGTIRSNMDPFEQYTNEEIWYALERCGMKKTIEEMPELLDARVAEYGENLSQGQRQLLCLGRALLKKCRILLLDEATSSVDFETDKEIQRTLREDFANCTVLTIAHRVNTIMDSDKILVMKDGKVGEFASPEDLLADKNSTFYDIVKHSHAEHA
jgi:ABC-type multidrug transport system fused ATPase/permease subunit